MDSADGAASLHFEACKWLHVTSRWLVFGHKLVQSHFITLMLFEVMVIKGSHISLGLYGLLCLSELSTAL